MKAIMNALIFQYLNPDDEELVENIICNETRNLFSSYA